MKEGQKFKTNEIFQTALHGYSSTTYQTFVIARSKFPPAAPERKSIVYRELVYKCVHGGKHQWRGTGKQHTRQIECPVNFRVSGRKKDQALIVVDRKPRRTKE